MECRSLPGNVRLKLVELNTTWVVCIDYLEEWVDVLALNRNLQLRYQVGDLINGEVATLVEVEVVKDLLKERWVLARELPNAWLDLS